MYIYRENTKKTHTIWYFPPVSCNAARAMKDKPLGKASGSPFLFVLCLLPLVYLTALLIMKVVHSIPLYYTMLHYPRIHTYTHTDTYSYIYTFIHAYMHTYIHTCMHACIHTYIHAYIPTYVRTYIRPDIETYIRVCIHSCIHSYIHPFIHSYIQTFMYSYIHSFIYSYIHTYIKLHRFNIDIIIDMNTDMILAIASH